jgi:hypothetical protein
MKLVIPLVAGIALLLSPCVVRAQAATTPAEYDLVAHHIAQARGTDYALPAGYRLTNAVPTTSGQFTITLQELRREPTHELAALVIQMHHPNWATPRYLCLPNAASDPSLTQRYLTEVSALTPGNTQALAAALALGLATRSALPH